MKRRSLNGPVVDSGVYSYERTRFKATTKRSRPTSALALIRNMTYYHCYDQTIKAQVGYWRHASPPQVTFGPSSVRASARTPHYSMMTESEKIATERLLAKVKGEVWNLSTFLGELPETLGWFKQTAKALVDSYIAVRRGRIKDVARIVRRVRRRTNAQPVRELHRVTDKVSSRWLEWRYAVSPLMYDLDDMLSYLHDASVKVSIRREAGGHTDRHSIRFKPSQGSNGVWTSEWHARALCYYRVNANAEAFKKLGLLNPLATLWELAPLSFVVDWFLPIGTYLANLDAMAGVTVEGSCITRRESEKDVQMGLNYPDYWTSGPAEFTCERYSRSLGIPRTPPLPRFGLSLSGKQMLDSLALLRQIALKG